MSTSIGLGYTTRSNVDFFFDVQKLAEKYEYGLLKGIDYAEQDIKDGVVGAQKNESWENVLFLQSPKDNEVALAFGIHEELVAFETKGQRPRFFDFLIELAALCFAQCEKLSIFFAAEWYENDRVRFSYGSAEDLISLLSMPGNWGIRYMIPQTGGLQDSDEIPLLFDLKF